MVQEVQEQRRNRQEGFHMQGATTIPVNGSRIPGQMLMHKRRSVSAHVPGANGPRSSRTEYNAGVIGEQEESGRDMFYAPIHLQW